MGDKTGIEWTDATWNPVRGCSRVSEGCRHCYAEQIAARFSGPGQPYEGLADRAKSGSKWTGKVRLIEEALDQPLRWRRPRRIFVNSMSDLFHENLPDEAIDRVFAVMALAPQHTFQVLTKRPDRMLEWSLRNATGGRIFHLAGELGKPQSGAWPRPNIWLGVSVEDQRAADERIPLLLQTPAAKRFLSCEPLLGPVDLSRCGKHYTGSGPLHLWKTDLEGNGGWRQQHGAKTGEDPPEIDWVIAGGESRSGARPMHPDWARSLRDQCAAAGVPFFFKQWGEYLPDDPAPDAHTAMRRVGKKAAGARLDGREHREFPA